MAGEAVELVESLKEVRIFADSTEEALALLERAILEDALEKIQENMTWTETADMGPEADAQTVLYNLEIIIARVLGVNIDAHLYA